ncbi:unnamed protein product, partial [Phaeothamnion confervicola]
VFFGPRPDATPFLRTCIGCMVERTASAAALTAAAAVLGLKGSVASLRGIAAGSKAAAAGFEGARPAVKIDAEAAASSSASADAPAASGPLSPPMDLNSGEVKAEAAEEEEYYLEEGEEKRGWADRRSAPKPSPFSRRNPLASGGHHGGGGYGESYEDSVATTLLRGTSQHLTLDQPAHFLLDAVAHLGK